MHLVQMVPQSNPLLCVVQWVFSFPLKISSDLQLVHIYWWGIDGSTVKALGYCSEGYRFKPQHSQAGAVWGLEQGP